MAIFVAKQEGQHMGAASTLKRQDNIVARQKNLRKAAPNIKQARQHSLLDTARFPVCQQRSDIRLVTLERLQGLVPTRIVDGAAIVGVHQTEVPELSSLIKVRHAWRP